MTRLLLPRRAAAPTIVDTPAERMLRDRHVAHLLDLAADYDDEGSQAAIGGNPKRARYLMEYWSPRVRLVADYVASEPLRKALAR